MKHPAFLSAAAIVCSMIFGCGGVPADFPKVAPCTITVKNGSTPISGVEVFLAPEKGGDIGKYTIKGTTNSSGAATIQTITLGYSVKGAPQGEFIVYLKKDPPYPVGTKTPEEFDAMDERARNAYQQQLDKEYQALPREIPQKYSNGAASGLKITIEAGKGGTLEVDVSN